MHKIRENAAKKAMAYANQVLNTAIAHQTVVAGTSAQILRLKKNIKNSQIDEKKPLSIPKLKIKPIQVRLHNTEK